MTTALTYHAEISTVVTECDGAYSADVSWLRVAPDDHVTREWATFTGSSLQEVRSAVRSFTLKLRTPPPPFAATR